MRVDCCGCGVTARVRLLNCGIVAPLDCSQSLRKWPAFPSKPFSWSLRASIAAPFAIRHSSMGARAVRAGLLISCRHRPAQATAQAMLIKQQTNNNRSANDSVARQQHAVLRDRMRSVRKAEKMRNWRCLSEVGVAVAMLV